jgi:hypothetical protein
MRPYAVVDNIQFKLTLCPPQSRLQHHIYHIGNPILTESTLTIGQRRLYSQVRDLGFGLRNCFHERPIGGGHPGDPVRSEAAAGARV